MVVARWKLLLVEGIILTCAVALCATVLLMFYGTGASALREHDNAVLAASRTTIAGNEVIKSVLPPHGSLEVHRGGNITFIAGNGFKLDRWEQRGLRPGSFVFLFGDGSEALRLDPGGETFVRGEKVASNTETFKLFEIWLQTSFITYPSRTTMVPGPIRCDASACHDGTYPNPCFVEEVPVCVGPGLELLNPSWLGWERGRPEPVTVTTPVPGSMPILIYPGPGNVVLAPNNQPATPPVLSK